MSDRNRTEDHYNGDGFVVADNQAVSNGVVCDIVERCECGCDRKFHEASTRTCWLCNDFCVYKPVFQLAPAGEA